MTLLVHCMNGQRDDIVGALHDPEHPTNGQHDDVGTLHDLECPTKGQCTVQPRMPHK